MVARFSITLLGWNGYLLLIVHLHSYQSLFETRNDLSSSQNHLERFVVSRPVVETRRHGLLLHRSVEDLSTRKPAQVVDRYCVALLSLQLRIAQINRPGNIFSGVNS